MHKCPYPELEASGHKSQLLASARRQTADESRCQLPPTEENNKKTAQPEARIS